MKKNKVAFYSILVLAAVMAVLALVHLQTRTPPLRGICVSNPTGQPSPSLWRI